MIDLCMVAAGEVPMEVDRVSCFNSAVMGFSPLVFNLNPNSGFDQLLAACYEVWENVANERTVLDNWVGDKTLMILFVLVNFPCSSSTRKCLVWCLV